ncbi:hypothetical protein BO83DRAFT_376251, partial [Aspergillus eucalypticola CBS 122712]
MSSNVGLSTPRGSGTSGYVQRNFAFMKPRNAGYGAPYPPISGANSSSDHPLDKPFKQRQPDKQILEHDRRRAIEVKVMEERERLEEENERIEEERSKKKGSKKEEEVKKEEGEEDESEGDEEKVLTEEEIDERCEALRKKLVREMEEEEKERERGNGGGNGGGGGGGGAGRRGRRAWDLPPKERRQFKSYQVHELAEAKIEESERLRRALGIKED